MIIECIENWLRKRRLRKSMKTDDGRRFFSANVMGGRTRMERLNGGRMELMNSSGTISLTTGAVPEPEDDREEVQPVDVIHLVETDVEVNIEDLDGKLKILEEKAILYSETLSRGVPEDLYHAIEVLMARKKYPKVEQLIPWKTTTKEKIDKLCKKYKLDHKPTSVFLPEFPEEVLEEVKKFKYIYEKVIDKTISSPKPDLSIIAHPDLFEKEPKGDPILLAKSPFGDYYFVLCAWDKEVDYVGDLLA